MSSLVIASGPLRLYSSHDILLSPSHTSSPFLPLGFISSFLEFSFYRKEFSDHLSFRSDWGPLHFSYHLSLPPSQTLSRCIVTVWVIFCLTFYPKYFIQNSKPFIQFLKALYFIFCINVEIFMFLYWKSFFTFFKI